jgi:hypothetical protein
MLLFRAAALVGLGIAMLPDHACAAELRAGTLVHVLPEWRREAGIVHLVFTSRTGLPPLVRAWIDHLSKGLKHPELFAERGPGYDSRLPAKRAASRSRLNISAIQSTNARVLPGSKVRDAK